MAGIKSREEGIQKSTPRGQASPRGKRQAKADNEACSPKPVLSVRTCSRRHAPWVMQIVSKARRDADAEYKRTMDKALEVSALRRCGSYRREKPSG
ncbi:MAG: hypothetical protein U0176_08385 [Bacteroidia bacterium]